MISGRVGLKSESVSKSKNRSGMSPENRTHVSASRSRCSTAIWFALKEFEPAIQHMMLLVCELWEILVTASKISLCHGQIQQDILDHRKLGGVPGLVTLAAIAWTPDQ
jgi:hypothetical protein